MKIRFVSEQIKLVESVIHKPEFKDVKDQFQESLRNLKQSHQAMLNVRQQLQRG